MPYRHLVIHRQGPVEFLALARPDVRNALNDELIAELTDWTRTHDTAGLRAVVLSGTGPTFCAGADVAWMARTVDYSEAENLRDASLLARMFSGMDSLPVPLIGRIHGAAIGGGAGLAAVCDIVVASEETTFGFSEVKLGIVPAVISPFVLAKIGPSAARALFVTGARFSAVRAREIGLVHGVVAAGALDDAVGRHLQEILAAGPESIAAAKQLLREIADQPAETVAELTASVIAARRVSREGQEGLRAFLDKRQPAWGTDAPAPPFAPAASTHPTRR
jgi:methylglutaconyl-CoA hydratase